MDDILCNEISDRSAPVVRKTLPLRLTTKFDSKSSIFHHKACCVLSGDSLAKLKLSFYNHTSALSTFSNPCVDFVSKILTLHYNIREQSALLTTNVPLGSNLRLSTSHKLTAQSHQGELSLVANFSQSDYALQIFSPLPALSVSRANLKSPICELSLIKAEDEAITANDSLSTSGNLKAQLLNGDFSVQFGDECCLLRYSLKNSAVSFVPALALPSNAVSFAIKQRLSPSSKLSCWVDCAANNWRSVFKHKRGNDLTFKGGYDSDVGRWWASMWMGDEEGKTKASLMKMNVQLMLQVPQNDFKASSLTFHFKKRWDI